MNNAVSSQNSVELVIVSIIKTKETNYISYSVQQHVVLAAKDTFPVFIAI